MAPAITFEDKVDEDKGKGQLVFYLQCGLHIIDGGSAVLIKGTKLERRYYMIHLNSSVDSKVICSLKKGEMIKTKSWFCAKQITESEFGTYKEFDLFPVLEHYNESSGQQSPEIQE